MLQHDGSGLVLREENEFESVRHELVAFGPDTFMMGDDAVPGAREAPAHRVEVGPFELGRCCVSAQEYAQYIADADGTFDESWCDYIDPCFLIRTGTGIVVRPGGERFPMVQISYWGCAGFCNWLSVRAGLDPVYDLEHHSGDHTRSGFRLPLESEWEYACLRGYPDDSAISAATTGIVNHRDTGELAGGPRASATGVGGYAFPAWSPVAVGTLPADRAGLHEMLGNVREWCHEGYGHYPVPAERAARGPYRGVRGGSFMDPAGICRPKVRAAVHETNKCMQYGFRIARTLP